MPSKRDALNQIYQLALSADLSGKEIFDYINKQEPQSEKVNLFTKVLAYLGGVFLLGGVVAFASMFWDEMGPIMHIIVTLGIGFGIYLSATFLSLKSRQNKLITPMYIVGFLLEILGIFVFLSIYFESKNRWEEPTLLVFTVLFIQQFFTFLALKRTALLFNAIVCVCFCLFALMEILHFDESLIFALAGLFLMATSYFIDKTEHFTITPFWYFFGSAFFLGAIFDLLESNNIDIAFLLPSCFFVYLSTLVKSRTLLFVSIISVFAFIGYYTTEYFTDSIGWPLSLIIIGLVLFGLSSLGYKLGKRI